MWRSCNNEEFILNLMYLANIFMKLNKLNLYLQGANIFAVYGKIKGFMKNFYYDPKTLNSKFMMALKHFKLL